MKAQLLIRRAFCSTITPSANAKITHPSRLARFVKPGTFSIHVSLTQSLLGTPWCLSTSQTACLARHSFSSTRWLRETSPFGLWFKPGDVSELGKGIRKSPGYSWTEVGDNVHGFTRGGTSGTTHPEHEAIVKFLDEWDGLLRLAGYKPVCSNGLDNEEKVDSLRYHSERLAVAYGVLKAPEGVPIRVLKNLNVCGDCHAAIKLLSKVIEREIIVRDAKGFHHFKNGECSCND